MKVCEGKKTFPSHALAETARQRHQEVARTVWFCQQCQGFHLGTNAPKAARVNRKKARLLELTQSELYEYESRN